MPLPKIGDCVTCKIEMPAYYSGYAGNPVMLFKPGMEGAITNIAPKVRKCKGPGLDSKDDFLVVQYTAPETNKTEQVALDFCNAVVA